MTDERNIEIEKFLREVCLLKNFGRKSFASDASFRKYERISINDGKKSYILMDAPPDKEDIKPFIKIDELLYGYGLSAPEIFFSDVENGFILMEDFGDNLFNKIITPDNQEKLYKLALQILIEIKNNIIDLRDIKPYTKEILIKESELFIDWFLPLHNNFSEEKIEDLRLQFNSLIREMLDSLELFEDNLILRDYHADNLIYIDNYEGLQKAGLLDFQDAVSGNPAYDVVSLLEDARRDVSKDFREKMLEYYIEVSGYFPERFEPDYRKLGIQRNLKILGIFSRLKVRDGKSNYISMIPRVKNYIFDNLEHKELENIKDFLIGSCDLRR